MAKTQIIQFTPSDLPSDATPLPKPAKPPRPAGVAKTALMSAPTAEDEAPAVVARDATPMPRRPAGATGPARMFTGMGQEGLAAAAKKAREERTQRRRELVTQALQRVALSPDLISEIEIGVSKALEDVEKQVGELEKENARLILESEDLRREVKALKVLSDDDDDDVGTGKRYTEAELKEHLASMEKACREEAEKALARTAELAKEKINRWKAEAKRLQAILAEKGIDAKAAAGDD